MKKRAIAVLGLTALLGVSNIIGVTAAGAGNSQDASSAATVELTAEGDVDPTGPVDPEFPDENIIPDDGDEITNNTGRLRIDYVSNFRFGKADIQDKDMILYANTVKTIKDNDTYYTPNFVQVSDWRGTHSGWSVSVKQETNFITTAAQGENYYGHEIIGAEITLNNITANTKSYNTPVSAVAEQITLNEQSQFVFGAVNGEGGGTHVAHFGNLHKNMTDENAAATSVELNVPKESQKYATSYKATLLWTISDTPGNIGEEEDGNIDIDIDIDDWRTPGNEGGGVSI